jgi:hypothetical protein
VVLEIIGELVLAVVELREDDDDVQFEVAKTLVKWHPQIRPAAVSRCDWRLGPWLCRAEHGGGQCARIDLGSDVHTRGAEDRGNLGGEVCRDEMHWILENSSPEFQLRTARSR